MHAAGTLVISGSDVARLCRWSLADRPRESCGLLLGRRRSRRGSRAPGLASPPSGGGRHVIRVEHVSRARNLSPEPERAFELDPGDLVAADAAARARGLEVVGVWHSHPGSPPRPSARDREHAWSGWSHLIVAVTGASACSLRCWSLGGRAVSEVELRIEPGTPGTRASRGRGRMPRPSGSNHGGDRA